MTHNETTQTEIKTDDARGAVRKTGMFPVLIVSTISAVLVLGIAYALFAAG